MKRREFAGLSDDGLRKWRGITGAMIVMQERRGKLESMREGCEYLDRIDAEIDRRAGRRIDA
jgi:hypothetical protein